MQRRCSAPPFALLMQVLLSYYWMTGLQLCHSRTTIPALTVDNTAILNVTGLPGVSSSWTDSYSVGTACYCSTTFDHDIDEFVVVVDTGPSTAVSNSSNSGSQPQNLTIREVCELLGPGPGKDGRPVYNDIQCGNGPANTAGDESDCPGRTDHGQEGCKYIGPKWNFLSNATTVPDRNTTTVPDRK
jgi:hypothetical protein